METQYERTYCEGCGTFRFKAADELCWHCKSPAEQRAIRERATFAAPGSQPVTFGGVTIDAPGFDQDSFTRALCRSFADDLVIHECAGYHLVCHRKLNGGYHVTRTSCDCKVGEHGTPCKHRAMLIFHLDVREPAVRRQWADARQAVAA